MSEARHVVLVVFDTLRRDALGCYGTPAEWAPTLAADAAALHPEGARLAARGGPSPLAGPIATPHLDKLASEGMVFTEAHGSSALCTPTRYGILTGRYNWRSRLQQGVLAPFAPPLIARELNLSRAEVHGVVTFYHEFRSHPPGQHVVRICRAEACQSMGGREIADHACKVLDLDWHGTTPDGRVTLEPVYCLGLCSTAPSAQIDGELHGRLDRDTIAALIQEVRQ